MLTAQLNATRKGSVAGKTMNSVGFYARAATTHVTHFHRVEHDQLGLTFL
jgi:hypothetical protein